MEVTKGQNQGHVKVKHHDVTDNSESLRCRQTAKHNQQEKPGSNDVPHHFKFTAIFGLTNQSTVCGRWLFLNLLNLKVLFLGALKTLPWYAIILACLAIPIDAIFKTKFVSTSDILFGKGEEGIHGSNGRQGCTFPSGGPNSFIFMRFSAKKFKNNSTFGSCCTPLGKILDPPLGGNWK